MSLLLPDGIDHLLDLPYTHFDAIRDALGYLSFEELPRDERPPRAIWRDPKAIRAWFRDVEAERERKFGANKGVYDEPIEGPVSENDVEALLGMR